MLAELANLPGSSADDLSRLAAAQSFIEQYGPLREHPEKDTRDQGPLPLKIAEVLEYGRRFNVAWEWREKADFDYRQFNRMLEAIFTEADSISGTRPAVRANFYTGTLEPLPRDLLQRLAMELMRSRKMLHRCERPECRKYMVKDFSRDRYCSPMCADVMRSRKQSKWAEDHSAEIKRRRKKRGTK